MKLVHWCTVMLMAGLVATGRGAEQYTEFFYGSFDLEGVALTFTPDGSPDYYSADAVAISELPVSHANHAISVLPDDGSDQVHFSGSKRFIFYGEEYTGVNIGSNGYLTFDEHDTTFSVSTENHFRTPRISTYYNDLDPRWGVGSVRYKQLSDRFVVTFVGIPEYNGGTISENLHTFQTELFFDGRIRMSWLRIDNLSDFAIVGLSAGGGSPAGFTESDLSSFAKDIDGDGILDDWEEFHFGSHSSCVATNDFDLDGFDNRSEYICGTHPKNKDSYFALSMGGSASDAVIVWPGAEGRRYKISRCNNLGVTPFTEVDTVEFPRNSYTNSGGDIGFFKVDVELID